jgi:carboxyl-terminal processing protease
MKTKILFIAILTCSITVMAQKQFDNPIQVNRNEGEMFDLRTLDWLNAFDSLHSIMQVRYPFTEWKGINWDQKFTQTQPKIQEAQTEFDVVKFTGAMLEYLYSIPDGHIAYFGDSLFKQTTQSGSFGLNILPISDGSIVVNIVPDSNAAYLTGIRCGDEIISWNGTPISELPEQKVYNSSCGTMEGKLLNRYQLLCRDSVGAMVDITFVSRETGNQHTVTLTAEADNFQLYDQSRFLTGYIPDPNNLVYHEILDNQVGYLRLLSELCPDGLTLDSIRKTDIYLAVKEAITDFNEQNIEKLVFDLRINNGGIPLLGSAISGFFIETPLFWEYSSGSSTINFAILDTIITVPESTHFDGEVIVIVGPNDISTGEGIPMILQRLPNVRVVSFWGTNGSFGNMYDLVVMPVEGQFFIYPYGRSYDENMVIQLDSDSNMVGGIQPDIRIPLTVERVIEQWQDGKDVELEYAIGLLLGIDEPIAENLSKIYPNPAFDLVTVECPDIREVLLISPTGQTVLHKKVDGLSSVQLSASSLPSGLYLCQIITSHMMHSQRVIIIH